MNEALDGIFLIQGAQEPPGNSCQKPSRMRILFEGGETMADNGLVTTLSANSVPQTVQQLISSVTSKGMTVFATIDHGANAKEAGFAMKPTVLVIFGNPKAGTPLMIDKPTISLDLPVKVLIWEDDDAKVWLTYTETAWLARRHNLSESSQPIIQAIAEGIRLVVSEASRPTQL